MNLTKKFCFWLSIILTLSHFTSSQKSGIYDDYYFTHEVKYEFVSGIFQRGLLLSTSYFISDGDVQQAYTGVCGLPILFTRIVSDIAMGTLDYGSNGAKAAVMFAFNMETATAGKKIPDIGSKTFQDYEKNSLVANKIQKVCYSSEGDVGGGSVSMPSNRYSGFADSQSIYKAVIKDSASGKLISYTNEQGWGSGIAINSTNLRFVIFKVRPVFGNLQNPCVALKDEISSARVDMSVTHTGGFDYYTDSVNKYFKQSSATWKSETKAFENVSCQLFCMDSTCNNSIWVDSKIKKIWDIARSIKTYFRVMPLDSDRKKIMKLS
jgi:hypothetical protein